MSNSYYQFLRASEMQRRRVMRLLKKSNGNMAEVGRIVGISRERVRQIVRMELKR